MASRAAAASMEEAGAAPEPAPTQGTEAWGSWSNGNRAISLCISLPASVRTRDVLCEVVEGWLLVAAEVQEERLYEDGVWGGEEPIPEPGASGEPPLLFGRLMQPVIASELTWGIDEADGRRELCIELPKVPRLPESEYASADCIFDETLLIGGESCLKPGLSQGTITMRVKPGC